MFHRPVVLSRVPGAVLCVRGIRHAPQNPARRTSSCALHRSLGTTAPCSFLLLSSLRLSRILTLAPLPFCFVRRLHYARTSDRAGSGLDPCLFWPGPFHTGRAGSVYLAWPVFNGPGRAWPVSHGPGRAWRPGPFSKAPQHVMGGSKEVG